MGTYNIPRNTKGEGRILFIFSTKGLIYTAIGGFIGFPFHLIISSLTNTTIPGLIVVGFFGLIGFCIGTFKFPMIGALGGADSFGGEKIDDVIKRYFLFKRGKNKIYINQEEGEKNG